MNRYSIYKTGPTPKTITCKEILKSHFKLSPNWEMRLDLKVNDQPNKWSSILVVSNTDLQEGEYGSRMPSFALTQNGELEVTVSFDRNKITGWKSGKLGQTWFNLRLRHYDGEFQIYLDNVLELVTTSFIELKIINLLIKFI